MTEILFDLRKNGALVTSKAVIAALLLASIYNVLSFCIDGKCHRYPVR